MVQSFVWCANKFVDDQEAAARKIRAFEVLNIYVSNTSRHILS